MKLGMCILWVVGQNFWKAESRILAPVPCGGHPKLSLVGRGDFLEHSVVDKWCECMCVYVDDVDGLSVVIAAGPFSTSDNILYEPLNDLKTCLDTDSPPDVCILVCTTICSLLLSASLYFSKRGAYWDRLCRDVVGRWLSRACTVAKRCILGL